MMRKRIINSYTPEGRREIHKNLSGIVDTDITHYLMRNPILYQTTQFNDNRISLYCAQLGKCAVTGAKLEIGDIHCHHKVPKRFGGTDQYQNLIIVSQDVHRLIHATNLNIIQKYLSSLKLDKKQYDKLNKLRRLAHVESCECLGKSYPDGKPDELK